MTEHEAVRLGLVGVGRWGRNLLRVVSRLAGARLVAVCDSNAERLATCRQGHPGVKLLDSYEELLKEEQLQAVMIASSTPTHAPFARRALEAGKDVYVEKPMAWDLASAEQLAAAAARTGRILMVGHLLQYHPATREIQKLIASPEFGELYYMYCQRVNYGIVRSDENVWWSLAPHDLSLACTFFGSRPLALRVQGSCYLQQEIADVSFATLEFPEGRLAHIHVSWLDPHRLRKVTLVGSHQMIIFDDTESREKLKVLEGTGRREVAYATYAELFSLRIGDIRIPALDATEPLALECRAFVECVRTRRAPRTGPDEGLEVVRILEAGDRSMRAGGERMELG